MQQRRDKWPWDSKELTPDRANGGISSVEWAYRHDAPLVQRWLMKYLHISVLYLLPLKGPLLPSVACAGLAPVAAAPVAAAVVAGTSVTSAAGTCKPMQHACQHRGLKGVHTSGDGEINQQDFGALSNDPAQS